MNVSLPIVELAPRHRGRWNGALLDIVRSLVSWRLWAVLGYREMRSQYARSVFGPFWQTVIAFAWIGVLSFIFSNVFPLEADIDFFVMYVAFGVVLFNFINAVVTGASDVFIRSRILIHSHPCPLFVHPLRLVMGAICQLGFQALAIVPFFILFPISITPALWLVIPGMVLAIAMAVATAVLLSLAGARFGDFRFAVLAIMRLMFFVTPLFWTLDQWSGAPLLLVTLNPITSFIAIVRDPLLGAVPDAIAYYNALAWTAAFGVTGLLWFARARSTIPMWV